jgi:hypothetical protein
MSIFCPENADEVQKASHVGKKAMVIVFFNGHGMDFIDILSQNQKVTAE